MPWYNPETQTLEFTRREALVLAALLLTGCGSPSRPPTTNPTINAPSQATSNTPVGQIQGPPAAATESPELLAAEKLIATKGFEVSLDISTIPGAMPARPEDKTNVVNSISRIITISPEISAFFDTQQHVTVYIINSLLNGDSGTVGSTDSFFAEELKGLENRHSLKRSIIITGQGALNVMHQRHPEYVIFKDYSFPDLQTIAVLNEMLNYLGGSQDISNYLQSLQTQGIIKLPIDFNRFIYRSLGGDIMVFDKASGKRIAEFSGAEQFFGDLLQAYITQKLGDNGNPNFIPLENEFASIAIDSRFKPIASIYQKLRTILKSESGTNLAIDIAKAKSEGNIQGLFASIQSNITPEEFKLLQTYLLNADIARK